MRWLPLVHGQGPLTAANGFNSQADVVIEARRAGDAARRDADGPARGRRGASAHRPRLRRADLQRAAHSRPGRRRQPARRTTATATSSRSCRRCVNGKPDHAATECDWGFFLARRRPVRGRRTARATRTRSSANGWVAAPDNVAFDPKGRIWISTDGQDDAAGFNDSLYAAHDERPERGATRCFFNGPRGAEICGPSSRPTARRCSSPSSTRATRARPSTSRRRAGRTSAPTCRRAARCWRSPRTTAARSGHEENPVVAGLWCPAHPWRRRFPPSRSG